MDPDPTDERGRRADLYRLLARLYADVVDAALLRGMADSGFLPALVADEETRARLASADGDALEELADGYTVLLVGPAPRVPPWGSVHHPADQGALSGETTAWLQRFAKEHSLAFDGPGYRGVPDHVAVELELIARLVPRGEEVDPSLSRLLEEHTLPWLRPFCQRLETEAARLEAGTARRLYAGLARLTRDLLADEAVRVGLEAAP